MNVTGSQETAALLPISIRASCNGRTPSIDLECAQKSSLKDSCQQLESNLDVLESGYLKPKFYFLCFSNSETIKMRVTFKRKKQKQKTTKKKKKTLKFQCSFSSSKTEQQINVDVNKCINM